MRGVLTLSVDVELMWTGFQLFDKSCGRVDGSLFDSNFCAREGMREKAKRRWTVMGRSTQEPIPLTSKTMSRHDTELCLRGGYVYKVVLKRIR